MNGVVVTVEVAEDVAVVIGVVVAVVIGVVLSVEVAVVVTVDNAQFSKLPPCWNASTASERK